MVCTYVVLQGTNLVCTGVALDLRFHEAVSPPLGRASMRSNSLRSNSNSLRSNSSPRVSRGGRTLDERGMRAVAVQASADAD